MAEPDQEQDKRGVSLVRSGLMLSDAAHIVTRRRRLDEQTMEARSFGWIDAGELG